MKKLLLLCLLFLNGCVFSHTYYFPNVPKENAVREIPETEKAEVCISVSFANFPREGEKYEAQKLKEKLTGSGLFKRVKLALPDDKNDFHIHFSFQHEGSSPDNRMGAAFLSMYTLTAIPASVYNTMDVVMTIYVKGKEVYSLVAPHYENRVVWGPLLAVFPFAIAASIPDKDRYIRYFIQQIEKNKLYNPAYFAVANN